MNNIRNFCIIAHIDHGKSTLADRLLEITKTIPQRKMREQYLDQMDLERERGITIKLQPVRMVWHNYILNLIDTPGHVDFFYEVSRSLAAVEGAILLVDATQGIQAQTLSTLSMALKEGLTIIPVVNKIDLANAQPEEVIKELSVLLKVKPEEVLKISAKKGTNVEKLLERIIKKIPPPQEKEDAPFRALIFDSRFDEYKGVIIYLKVVEGEIKKGEKIKLLASNRESEVLEVGFFAPDLKESASLKSGEIGYLITGLKDLKSCRVGDTVAQVEYKGTKIQVQPLPGYKEVKPMIFAGLYCQEGTNFEKLKDALEKLKLTDAALSFELENSIALGPGFRGGFLGLLHLEIIQERLRREFGLEVIITSPTPAYRVILKKNHKEIIVHSPQELPRPEEIEYVEEPWMKIEIITPEEYIGPLLKLIKDNRGKFVSLDYLNQNLLSLRKNVMIKGEIPLTSLIANFYDKLKSVSSGFASFNYEFADYRRTDIVRLDVLVAGELVEALSMIVYQDTAYSSARKIVRTLKENLPRQLFEVKIQGVIGGKIIASERIPPLRKDVIAKLYGGDVSRKKKLLKKQKRGKKRMKLMGKVSIPAKVYLKILSR